MTCHAVHLYGPGGRRGRLQLGERPRPALRRLEMDGETQILRHIRSALSEAGYTPIVTGNPDEVKRLIEAEKPHLVLMDMALPGTDGIELFDSQC